MSGISRSSASAFVGYTVLYYSRFIDFYAPLVKSFFGATARRKRGSERVSIAAGFLGETHPMRRGLLAQLSCLFIGTHVIRIFAERKEVI